MKLQIGLVLALLLVAAPLRAQQGDKPATPPPRPQPRFIDLDGDGFNDLAPDRDGDGIPDYLDPDTKGARGPRWAWFRSVPDSARHDSVRFSRWWQRTNPNRDWRDAWRRWSWFRDATPQDRARMWFQHNGFDPRGHFIRSDLRRKMRERMDDRRRRRGGRPHHGGGGGMGG